MSGTLSVLSVTSTPKTWPSTMSELKTCRWLIDEAVAGLVAIEATETVLAGHREKLLILETRLPVFARESEPRSLGTGLATGTDAELAQDR